MKVDSNKIQKNNLNFDVGDWKTEQLLGKNKTNRKKILITSKTTNKTTLDTQYIKTMVIESKNRKRTINKQTIENKSRNE